MNFNTFLSPRVGVAAQMGSGKPRSSLISVEPSQAINVRHKENKP